MQSDQAITKDPAFESALQGYIHTLIEEEKKEYKPGIEPFSAHENRLTESVGQAVRAFGQSYVNGYILLLKELHTTAPGLDLAALQPSREAEVILNNPELLTNFLDQGYALYQLLGFSNEQMTALYMAAYQLIQARKITEAKDAYLFLTTIAPNLGPVWLGLGYCYDQCGEYENAVQACQNAVQLDPQDAETYLALSNLYIRMQKRDMAVQTLETGLAFAMQHRGEEWAETLGGILETSKNQIDTQTN